MPLPLGEPPSRCATTSAMTSAAEMAAAIISHGRSRCSPSRRTPEARSISRRVTRGESWARFTPQMLFIRRTHARCHESPRHAQGGGHSGSHGGVGLGVGVGDGVGVGVGLAVGVELIGGEGLAPVWASRPVLESVSVWASAWGPAVPVPQRPVAGRRSGQPRAVGSAQGWATPWGSGSPHGWGRPWRLVYRWARTIESHCPRGPLPAGWATRRRREPRRVDGSASRLRRSRRLQQARRRSRLRSRATATMAGPPRLTLLAATTVARPMRDRQASARHLRPQGAGSPGTQTRGWRRRVPVPRGPRRRAMRRTRHGERSRQVPVGNGPDTEYRRPVGHLAGAESA